MDDPNNAASVDAIATATLSAEDQAAAEARHAAAVAKAAEVIKLPVDKLKAAIAGLDIYELARVLEAEKAEGEGKTRNTAIEAIERAAEKLALAAAGAMPPADATDQPAPAANADPIQPVDGGPVDLELDGTDAGDAMAPSEAPARAGPDAIAAAAETASFEPAIAAAARELGVDRITFVDGVDLFDNAQVLELVRDAGAIIVIARREFAHAELTPVRAAPGEFERAHDGQRLVYTGNIELSGVGLPAPLPIEQAWLVSIVNGDPTIIRRCDMAGELTLDVGRFVAFRPRTLIF